MKLRLKHNSIRFRLTKSEIALLEQSGCVRETIDVGATFGGEFAYVLKVDPEIQVVKAEFVGRTITVSLSKAAADSLTKTDQVGIEFEQAVSGSGPLLLVVEKDFACLEPRHGEDQSDNFPHPNKDSHC